jgi:hypothetical protein
VVLLLPAIYISVTTYGAIGAAVVWVILNLGYVLIATPMMHRVLLTSEMWRWYRQDVLVPFAFALAAAAAVALLGSSASKESLMQNTLLLVLAMFATIASAAVATPLGRSEIRAMVCRVRLLLR